MTLIINASGLTDTESAVGVLPNTISLASPDVARQWPSLEAFLALCNKYAPTPIYCCEPFTQIYNLGWLIKRYHSSQAIRDYKIGRMNTDEFLSILYTEEFNFLADANLSNDQQAIASVSAMKNELYTLRGCDIEKPDFKWTDELVAKALLEQAWVARMQFTDKSSAQIQCLFSENSNEDIRIISNSNPLDMWHTVRHLWTAYPELDWIAENDLWEAIKKPDTKLMSAIALTKDGRVGLYVSYAHGMAKRGNLDGMIKTNDLLAWVVDHEKLSPKDVTLVSQWQGDLSSGNDLGLRCIAAQDYFTPELAQKKTA